MSTQRRRIDASRRRSNAYRSARGMLAMRGILAARDRAKSASEKSSVGARRRSSPSGISNAYIASGVLAGLAGTLFTVAYIRNKVDNLPSNNEMGLHDTIDRIVNKQRDLAFISPDDNMENFYNPEIYREAAREISSLYPVGENGERRWTTKNDVKANIEIAACLKKWFKIVSKDFNSITDPVTHVMMLPRYWYFLKVIGKEMLNIIDLLNDHITDRKNGKVPEFIRAYMNSELSMNNLKMAVAGIKSCERDVSAVAFLARTELFSNSEILGTDVIG